MLKRAGLIVVFVVLALLMAGCGSATYYTFHNGTKNQCGSAGTPDCGNDYYAVDNTNGMTYHCTGTPCFLTDPVTPPWNCSSKYAYENLADKGTSWKVITQQQDQNNSSVPAQVTFTSNTETTVKVSLDVHLSASADALLDVVYVSVKADINVSVTKSVSVTVGNSYNFTVPAGATAYGNYGVKVQITSGHLYDKATCEGKNSDLGNVVTYVPIAPGWCVWTTDETPCPSI
jgi:hypothetical protein